MCLRTWLLCVLKHRNNDAGLYKYTAESRCEPVALSFIPGLAVATTDLPRGLTESSFRIPRLPRVSFHLSFPENLPLLPQYLGVSSYIVRRFVPELLCSDTC